MGQSTSTARQTRSAMHASKEQQESSSGVSLAPELEGKLALEMSFPRGTFLFAFLTGSSLIACLKLRINRSYRARLLESELAG